MEPRSALTLGCARFRRQLLTLGCWRGSRHWQSADKQHGMVTLDDSGELVRDALLWNDNRSAPDAVDLIAELGGAQAWADAVCPSRP